jgi:bacterioferritin-associated ferredoxin
LYICHCNGLTDQAIQDAMTEGADCPHAVYAGCGCRAQCGGCTATILRMLRGGAVTIREIEKPSA